MRKIFWVMLGCLAQVTAQAASFDCAKVRTNMEKMICGDAELSRLDEDLSQAYRKALQRNDVKQGAIESQRQWLKEVQAKCSDVACMKRAYQDRISELGFTSSFGIVFMHAQPGSAPAAATPQASAATPVPVDAPAHAEEPAETETAAVRIAPHIPRLHLKTKPSVCKAVADAVNHDKVNQLVMKFPENGLLIDINGDGKKERVDLEVAMAHVGHTHIRIATVKGVPIELDPVDEGDEQLIESGGKYYIYSYSHDQEPDDIPLYIAILDKDNKEQIVCEFEETTPIVTISSSRNDTLCGLGHEKKLNYVPFDDPLGAVEMGNSKLTIEGSAASVDINNDGTQERVVQVADYSSNAWPVCVLQGLGVLNNAGNGLDDSFTELLVDQNCPNPAGAHRPFLFRGQTYIEILGPNGYPNNIVQLRGKKLSTVCAFNVQRVFRVLEN